jgi:hypothetical protein
MTVHTLNPAEPVVVDDGISYGGFTEIARRLSARHPERTRPISRQLVHRWYSTREYNDFPDTVDVRVRSGKIKAWFIIDEACEWYDGYRKYHQYPRYERHEPPSIDTIPLFELDSRGRLVS